VSPDGPRILRTPTGHLLAVDQQLRSSILPL
jgi:hypothetical protein